MKLSKFLAPTLKELPADADTVSAKLMLRAGMIRKVAAGVYEWLPLGLRALRKVERIVREEMDKAGGQEVWLPVLQPKELWEESGRWKHYGKELVRLKDRKDTEFCLAPTAEEVVTDLVRREVRSYREIPLLLYQFGEKFRDEIRPRFGVMRAREFYMKDAYSFHADEASVETTYKDVFDAYVRIFERCGLKFRPVEADTGSIGGTFSHEFMVLAETGEETIAHCEACGYAANVERAEVPEPSVAPSGSEAALSEIATPGLTSVEDVAKFLKASPDTFIKTQFMVADGAPVVALVRGDHTLSETKLRRALGAQTLDRANDTTYRSVAGCEPGFGGPVGLKVRLIADNALRNLFNGVSGANKNDAHLTGIKPGRDYTPEAWADIRVVGEGDRCARCAARGTESKIAFAKGIEVGHTFKLGTKYSAAMKAEFLDEKGERKPFVMGCYGIGVSRVVAAAIEQCSDADGIRWPLSLAPFAVEVVPLNMSAPAVVETAERLYRELLAGGVDVLLDDRDQRAGAKFKDADLLGAPWRITVGERKLPQGLVELKSRSGGQAEDVPVAEVVSRLLAAIQAG